MASQAHRIARLDQIRRIIGSMNIMAVETFHAAIVHCRRDVVIALHSILVGRTVGEVGECRLAELVLL